MGGHAGRPATIADRAAGLRPARRLTCWQDWAVRHLGIVLRDLPGGPPHYAAVASVGFLM